MSASRPFRMTFQPRALLEGLAEVQPSLEPAAFERRVQARLAPLSSPQRLALHKEACALLSLETRRGDGPTGQLDATCEHVRDVLRKGFHHDAMRTLAQAA